MSDNNIRNISNVKVSNECFKSLKKLSIDKETSLQKVVQEILERTMSKKKSVDNNEEK
jgi:hypothetical protein